MTDVPPPSADERTLHVYYRHVPQLMGASRHPGRERPSWFSHEACLRNFLATVRGDTRAAQVRMTMVFDGSFDEFKADFAARYVGAAANGMALQLVQGGSAINAWQANLALVRSTPMAGADLVCLVENDYLHRPGWVSRLFELFEGDERVDYASLYDHRDKYDHPYYASLTSRLISTAHQHWRSAPSTCGSFVVPRAVLDEDLAAIAQMPDFQLFSLLVGQRGRRLYTPVPGLATHCMAEHLAPTIDWQALVV